MKLTALNAMLIGAAVATLGGCGREGTAPAPAQAGASTSASAHDAMPGMATSGPFAQDDARMMSAMEAAVGASAEHTWAEKMIAHHEGAIAMSRTLLAQSSGDAALRRIAQTVIDEQGREVAQFQGWLRDNPDEGAMPVNPFGQVESEMHKQMMSASGETVDQTWARKMIAHHEGAIDMSTTVLPLAQDAQIKLWARLIVTAQREDNAELERWLATSPG